MKTTHTPGPWYEASTGNHQGLVIAEKSGTSIAVTYDKTDARLIAAAPDLLAALKRCERALEERDTEAEEYAAKHAREIIAQAEGRS